jgi:hypothetical protein
LTRRSWEWCSMPKERELAEQSTRYMAQLL